MSGWPENGVRVIRLVLQVSWNLVPLAILGDCCWLLGCTIGRSAGGQQRVKTVGVNEAGFVEGRARVIDESS